MRDLANPIELRWLADQLHLPFIGNAECLISNISENTNVSPKALVFCKKEHHEYKDCVVIACAKSHSDSVILSENPRFDFIRSLAIINESIGFKAEFSSPSLHPSVIVGRNVVIDNGVTIGKNTVVEANAVILNGTTIGENCTIRAGSVIGADGFGFERDSSGAPIKFLHLGGVILGDNVDVGSNSCIAKGSLGNTIIEDYVKIDNLAQIAHNCHLKAGAFVLSGAAIGGSVVVGENSWIGPNAVIHQKKKIGTNVLVGMGSVVTKSIRDDMVVFGNPAKRL